MAEITPGALRRLVLSTWDHLRESFWFLPAILVSASLALALGLIAIDEAYAPTIADRLPFVHLGSPDGARTVLSVLAGAMITVTSLTFSLTIVALTLASQQFGPRLLRSFTRDGKTQFALGIFVATFAYCLVVLQAVRDRGGDTFVPSLAVSVSLALVILSLAVLVYFIHHVAISIQASTLLATVSRDIEDAMSRLFPDELGVSRHSSDEKNVSAGTNRSWQPKDPDYAFVMPAPDDGYVQIVDGDALLALAQRFDLSIELLCRPGMFLQQGEPVMHVWPAAEGRNAGDELARTLVLGSRRNLIQDAGFAVEQLVEVAVRALSPGVNDPFTAQACVERLGAALRRMASRPPPASVRLDADGHPRVHACPTTFAELAHVAFDDIRRAARGNTLVLGRILDVCGRLGAGVGGASERETVVAIATSTFEDASRSIHSPGDRGALERAYALCLRRCAVEPDTA